MVVNLLHVPGNLLISLKQQTQVVYPLAPRALLPDELTQLHALTLTVTAKYHKGLGLFTIYSQHFIPRKIIEIPPSCVQQHRTQMKLKPLKRIKLRGLLQLGD